jgi:hypothetical protein
MLSTSMQESTEQLPVEATLLLDNTRRMQLAQLMSWVRGGVALVEVVLMMMQYYWVKAIAAGEKLNEGSYDTFDAITVTLGYTQTIVAVLAFVAFARWFYRAYQNVHRLPGAEPDDDESMAGWGWFIPIYNLWKPYKIMVEIGRYIGRFEGAAGKGIASRWDLLLVVWWVLHIGGIVVGRVLAFLEKDTGETMEAILRSCRLMVFTECLMLASALATVLLLRQLAPRERELLTYSVSN